MDKALLEGCDECKCYTSTQCLMWFLYMCWFGSKCQYPKSTKRCHSHLSCKHHKSKRIVYTTDNVHTILYIYIHICGHEYTRIYIYTHVYIYICIHINLYIYTSVIYTYTIHITSMFSCGSLWVLPPETAPVGAWPVQTSVDFFCKILDGCSARHFQRFRHETRPLVGLSVGLWFVISKDVEKNEI